MSEINVSYIQGTLVNLPQRKKEIEIIINLFKELLKYCFK